MSSTTIHPFIHRTNERRDWPQAPSVCIWDIDKTYLDTHFSSIRGLLTIPLEFAIDKSAIAGAVPLLRALRHGPHDENRFTPLFFISGSPTHLRRVIEKKMLLDGVQYDGISFKNQWALLKHNRASSIKEQAWYKLFALAALAQECPIGSAFYLFGDDAEKDAAIFHFFAQCLQPYHDLDFTKALEELGCEPQERARLIAELQPLHSYQQSVKRIFIRITKSVNQHRVQENDVRYIPSFLDAAHLLVTDGMIRIEDLHTIAQEITHR